MDIPHDIGSRQAIAAVLATNPATKISGSLLGRNMKYRGSGLYSGSGGFWDSTRALREKLGAGFKAGASAMGMGHWGDALTGLESAGRSLGMGAYETPVSNEIVNGGEGLPVPSFSAGGGEMGTICISHREYVADVFGPESAGIFQNVTYGINPALPETFPWLSQIAANYEEYTIKQLIFTFRSTVSDFVASNGQVGTVIAATQYNANDAPFASKQDMMEYAGAVSAKVSEGMMAGVECDPNQMSGAPGKYTRAGPVPSNEDVKTYDLGTFNIATSNTPAQFNNQAMGELWVSYTVELRKPKFFVTRAQQLLTDVFLGCADPTSTAAGLDLGITSWGVGQQNRIGGYLAYELPTNNSVSPPITYPAQADTLYYVFPATFAGDIEVVVSSSLASTGTGGSTGVAVSTGLSTGAPGIRPIMDIWSTDPTAGNVGTWTYNVQGQTSTTDNKNCNTYHFSITSPTTANTPVDNVLVFKTDHPTGGISNWMIRISMYNTGLNYAKSHHVIMTNPGTGEVIQWPAGAGAVP